ncbi:MAG: PilZ domain-containing protein [Candidatus Omnitrophica bacterium]|nr:PilZ domain-containing protein [Candidatus Omnitrophota bacterium]MDD5352835.1 PilZ domain-containing protein [Candidatus Omnitrophota bacterium]MDD5550434.1 PilZ domain-containing protein [Candidatus Omnitrophota bacterium]
MNDESKWISLRRHPRISWGFIVKFRPQDKTSAEWEASTIKDISEGGCFFYSSTKYQPGQILEIRVQFPSLTEPMQFTGEVKRCESSVEKKSNIYGIAVCFLGMDEQKKKEFTRTITFFLSKQQKGKG